MKFPYRKFTLPEYHDCFGRSILKPIIPVKISFGGKFIRHEALIDSGADFCIFEAEIGEYLGINIREGVKISFRGIQGGKDSVAFLHQVVLNVGGWDYEIMVGFSDGISRKGFGALGQKGFFDLFVVKFNLASEEIEIKENRKNS